SEITMAVTREVGRTKTFLFALLTLGCVYAVAETAAYLAYWIIFHEPLSFQALSREREMLARNNWDESSSRGQRQAREVVHPFLGYVKNPRARQPQGVHTNEYGFTGESTPVQRRSSDKLIVAVL